MTLFTHVPAIGSRRNVIFFLFPFVGKVTKIVKFRDNSSNQSEERKRIVDLISSFRPCEI